MRVINSLNHKEMPEEEVKSELDIAYKEDKHFQDGNILYSMCASPSKFARDTHRRFIEANAKGTSPTMKKISQMTVMRIPFPKNVTLKKQRLMVKQLDMVQAKIAVLKSHQAQTGAELDALLPSILDRAFKGEP